MRLGGIGCLQRQIGLVLLLSIQSFDMVMLLFPAWVALLSVLMLTQAPQGAVAQD